MLGRKAIDLTGKKFNFFTVIKRVKNHGGKYAGAYWLCKCVCGREVIRYGSEVKRGAIHSCGCMRISEARRKKTTHGMTKGIFYKRYTGAKTRCTNKKCKDYVRYGGRGIKFLWGSFQEFYNDMYKSFEAHRDIYGQSNTSLDRIDNNGHYCKENCRWATWSEQAKNRRVVARNKLGQFAPKLQRVRKMIEDDKDLSERIKQALK